MSDRCAAGETRDTAGPAVAELLSEQLQANIAWAGIVPDEQKEIADRLTDLCSRGIDLVVTVGGTGCAKRDVTPEAIRAIMRVELPGFGEIMRSHSISITPNAILSRSLAAVVDTALVVALPGKPQGAVDCLGFVEGAIPHATKLAQDVPTSC